MRNFEEQIKKSIRAIEELANIIRDNANIEEYVREANWNLNEIYEALDNDDYKYAALLITQDELLYR